MQLFKMGGTITHKQALATGIIGAIVLLLLWYLVTVSGEIIRPQILPNPVNVLKAYPDLISNSALFTNTWYTVKLNLMGYFYALIIAIPLGLIIGLFPVTKALFGYLPIPTVSGIFIATIGIGFDMKASFLAFGITFFLSLFNEFPNFRIPLMIRIMCIYKPFQR